MGAKTWMVITCDGNPREILAAKPVLDRAATVALAPRLFAKRKLVPADDVDLTWTCPGGQQIVIGVFPGLTLVAAEEIGIDHPSELPEVLRTHSDHEWAYLHAMHSVVNWFAFGIWRHGKLVRSLSLSPDSGIAEDLGTRQPFELPYWAGEHAYPDDDPQDTGYPFESLDLGEAALSALFGYHLEGGDEPSLIDPQSIPLMRFDRKRRWFLF